MNPEKLLLRRARAHAHSHYYCFFWKYPLQTALSLRCNQTVLICAGNKSYFKGKGRLCWLLEHRTKSLHEVPVTVDCTSEDIYYNKNIDVSDGLANNVQLIHIERYEADK